MANEKRARGRDHQKGHNSEKRLAYAIEATSCASLPELLVPPPRPKTRTSQAVLRRRAEQKRRTRTAEKRERRAERKQLERKGECDNEVIGSNAVKR